MSHDHGALHSRADLLETIAREVRILADNRERKEDQLAAERDAMKEQRDRLARYIREVETNLPIIKWKPARQHHLTEGDMAFLDQA